jgi:quinol monooxygenase YgiN
MMPDEKQAIHVIAEAVAKPGHEEALYRTLHACVAPTRDEAGNRGYILHQDLDNPARFFLYETWVSREALNAHFMTPHFKALDQNVKPLVVRELSVAVLRAFDELAVEPQQIVLRLTEATDGCLGL